MANNLIGWFFKFFKDSGLGNGYPEGTRTVRFTKDSMTYSYQVKGNFFEEDSKKTWKMKDGIDRNYGTIYRNLKNSNFTQLWNLNWDMKDLVELKVILTNADTMWVTLETNITFNQFKITIKDGKEICEEVGGMVDE